MIEGIDTTYAETTKDFAPPAPATDAGTPDATGHVPGTFEKLENEAKDLF